MQLWRELGKGRGKCDHFIRDAVNRRCFCRNRDAGVEQFFELYALAGGMQNHDAELDDAVGYGINAGCFQVNRC